LITALADKVNTIDELVARYDSSQCAECHEDIHEDWAKSWHGQSMIDSRVLRTFRTFLLSGIDRLPDAKRRDFKDVCLPCHAPQTRDASDELVEKIADMFITAVEDKDEAKREAAKKELSKLNINCIACHNLYALPDGNPKPNTIYGPGDAEEPPHKEEFGFDTVKSEYLKTSKFCAKCHGCVLPSSECPTIYSSYEEHYLAHGGKETCQGCHMKAEGDGSTHRFPGIYEVDFAKTGIELALSASPTTYVYHLENRRVPGLVMNVKAKNTSGHGMPHG
jgi:hypothetical protein